VRSAEEWDELFTCSPMSAREALQSVRVKPAELRKVQADALLHALGIVMAHQCAPNVSALIKNLATHLSKMPQDAPQSDLSHSHPTDGSIATGKAS